jgi:ADP-ribose pyrophosphatase YjhB (NUDIX family)
MPFNIIYDKKYRNPLPTINAIIHNEKNQVLFIKRTKEPFKNHLSLPWGFVNYGEKAEEALIREVKEKTSLNIEPLEILGVYSDSNGDPRGHLLSTVFICLIIDGWEGKAEKTSGEICWIKLNEIDRNTYLYDHKIIMEDYLNWRFNNSTYWSSKNR